MTKAAVCRKQKVQIKREEEEEKLSLVFQHHGQLNRGSHGAFNYGWEIRASIREINKSTEFMKKLRQVLLFFLQL